MLIWEKSNYRSRFPLATIAIVFVGSMVFLLRVSEPLSFVPSDPFSITLLTSVFAHANLLHIIGNYVYLYKFGDNVEDVLGPFLYTVTYLFLGLAANLGYFLFHQDSSIRVLGASGAISGLLGIYCIFFPRVKTTILFGGGYSAGKIEDVSVFYALIFWILLQFVMLGFEVSGGSSIAFSAHLTGFFLGLALGFLYKRLSLLDKYENSIRRSTGKAKTVLCPSCHRPTPIPGYGRYKCPDCGTEYLFDRTGKRMIS